ncbi:MAG: hypothetical protein K2N48_04520 [Muribaculaceae bacterium]|nr:hypothetical protein [Muribaculaceae bacterium]
MELNIICDIAEKEDIKVFCEQLKKVGVKTKMLYQPTGILGRKAAMMPTFTMLWISSKTSDIIFNIAKERNEKNLTNINYFADSVALSDFQKNAIGRNHSVFASINPNESVNDVLSLIDAYLMTSSSKLLTKTDASLETKANTKGNNTRDIQITQSVKEDLQSKNSDELNNSIINSNKNDISLKEEQQKGNSSLWMPLVWYVTSILYYVSIHQGIIEGWTYQTKWFLAITAVWFVLTYKIIRSTIKAIKTNKWCYAYIPFSLIMISYDLLYGFRLLGAIID